MSSLALPWSLSRSFPSTALTDRGGDPGATYGGGSWVLASHLSEPGAGGPGETGRHSHELDDFVQTLNLKKALRVRSTFVQRQLSWGQEGASGPGSQARSELDTPGKGPLTGDPWDSGPPVGPDPSALLRPGWGGRSEVPSTSGRAPGRP